MGKLPEIFYLSFIGAALLLDSQIHAMSKSLVIAILILLAFSILEWTYEKFSVKKWQSWLNFMVQWLISLLNFLAVLPK